MINSEKHVYLLREDVFTIPTAVLDMKRWKKKKEISFFVTTRLAIHSFGEWQRVRPLGFINPTFWHPTPLLSKVLSMLTTFYVCTWLVALDHASNHESIPRTTSSSTSTTFGMVSAKSSCSHIVNRFWSRIFQVHIVHDANATPIIVSPGIKTREEGKNTQVWRTSGGHFIH